MHTLTAPTHLEISTVPVLADISATDLAAQVTNVVRASTAGG